jgi:hypothetical protein
MTACHAMLSVSLSVGKILAFSRCGMRQGAPVTRGVRDFRRPSEPASPVHLLEMVVADLQEGASGRAETFPPAK